MIYQIQKKDSQHCIAKHADTCYTNNEKYVFYGNLRETRLKYLKSRLNRNRWKIIPRTEN